jgi:hypothetical protein
MREAESTVDRGWVRFPECTAAGGTNRPAVSAFSVGSFSDLAVGSGSTGLGSLCEGRGGCRCRRRRVIIRLSKREARGGPEVDSGGG